MEKTPLGPILLAKILGSGSGSVTPGSLVIVSGQMTDAQAEQFRDNIGAISADDIGSVFVIKGSVATVADLPESGNSVGDVYYVEAVSAGYVWITSTEHPTGYWEELGEPIDLSAYEMKPTQDYPAGSSVTITPADNTIYNCGELTSLTISAMPSSGWCEFRFCSGATATLCTFPAGLVFPTDDGQFAGAEANKRYVVNCEKQADGTWLALVAEWPYTPLTP